MVQTIKEIIEKLQEAKKSNDRLQSKFVVGSPNWHACETIDDKLHDALALLGD